ncbi:HYR domain-containing protein, partial [Tenacibaculum adriaticum]
STDAAGNTATCTQVVTVVDNINPTISACPSAVTVNVDAGTCTASGVSLGAAPTGTDNCGVSTITNDAPATFPIGDTTVTWTSTDAAGNTATCTQVVTVVDNINPTISACPSAVTVNVDAGTCTASGVSLGAAPTGTDNCGVPTITNDAPATFPIGDTTVTWTSTDAAGNTATCTQVVTVVDNINPTISACPSAVTVNVDAGTCTASGVSLGAAPTGTDNCGVPTITNDAPATFPIGDTTVTWTSTDAAGNTATCTQVVTVVDNINPTISACPSAVTVNVDAGTCTASGVSLGAAPTGTDNCGVPTITNDAPATFPIGDTTVTWTSTDAAGNTATCTQVVTVVDNINPTISACPSAVTVNVDAGTCTASGVSLGAAPTGTDNCGVPTITNDAPATFPIGDTTVTWTSTDA